MSTQVLGVGMAGCQQPAEVTSLPVTATPPTPPLVVGAQVSAPEPHPPSFDGGTLEFIGSTFDELYPVFLIRRSMPHGDNAALWRGKYMGRWIRWAGTVRSKTSNGITLRHLPATTTFDISLHVESAQLPLLANVHVGDRVHYVGRLDGFNDIFRQFFLVHGGLIEVSHPHAVDGGAR